jgi:hypothetical protein
MSDLYRLLLGVLCTWRLTHLLQAEDGPWDASVYLRRAAGDGFFGQLLDCFYCLSLWIAAPVAWTLHSGAIDLAMLWPALSGGAILLERCTARTTHRPEAVQAQLEEDKEA